MEEGLILVLQALFELLLQILANAPIFFWPDHWHRGPPWSQQRPSLSAGSLAPMHFDGPGWTSLGLFVAGGVVGGFSVDLFRHVFLQVPFLRIANIFYAPITSGFLAYYIAVFRDMENPRRRCIYAVTFTLGLVLVRFMYAQR